MANFLLLPDDIVRNILARLPAKPLLWCRCVSKYWNRLITDPYFMSKLRSRRTIILPQFKTWLHIDVNVPSVEDTCNSILDERPYPLDNLRKNEITRVIGTFNGIVLLAYSHALILYNPFTGASKALPDPPGIRHAVGQEYGFGYGPDDHLKIVRFRRFVEICDVYNFKNGSWSSWSTSQYNIKKIIFEQFMGIFSNGFLYWLTSCNDKKALTVLNVKDMLLSEIDVLVYTIVLGTIEGCLCSLTDMKQHAPRFGLCVMKEHGVWSIRCSFNLPELEVSLKNMYFDILTLCILDSGRILMVTDRSRQPLIYDTSNDSYITFNIKLPEYYWFYHMQGLEYVESLFSPSDI